MQFKERYVSTLPIDLE